VINKFLFIAISISRRKGSRCILLYISRAQGFSRVTR